MLAFLILIHLSVDFVADLIKKSVITLKNVIKHFLTQLYPSSLKRTIDEIQTFDLRSTDRIPPTELAQRRI